MAMDERFGQTTEDVRRPTTSDDETDGDEELEEGEATEEGLEPDEEETDEDTFKLLDKLAELARGRPSLVRNEVTGEWVGFPNGKGRFQVRRMTAIEVRTWEAMQTKTTVRAKVGSAKKAAQNKQNVDVAMQRALSYLYLCEKGILVGEVVDERGVAQHVGHDKRGNTREVCGQLDPMVSRWLELYLQHANGLTAAQRRDLGND